MALVACPQPPAWTGTWRPSLLHPGNRCPHNANGDERDAAGCACCGKPASRSDRAWSFRPRREPSIIHGCIHLPIHQYPKRPAHRPWSVGMRPAHLMSIRGRSPGRGNIRCFWKDLPLRTRAKHGGSQTTLPCTVPAAWMPSLARPAQGRPRSDRPWRIRHVRPQRARRFRPSAPPTAGRSRPGGRQNGRSPGPHPGRAAGWWCSRS